MAEFLYTLLLQPEGRREKVRAQVAVLVKKSDGALVRHALVRAITGHSIPGVNPDKLSAVWRESTCDLCAGIFHRTTLKNLTAIFESGYLKPGAEVAGNGLNGRRWLQCSPFSSVDDVRCERRRLTRP